VSATLEATARQLGQWCWEEQRLFKVVGAWVVSTPEPSTKVYFDIASQHHAWRARQLEERLPRVAHLSLAELVAPADERAEQLMEALAGLNDSVSRLSVYLRSVLPRRIRAYNAWRSQSSLCSDLSVIRALGFVALDLGQDWEQGVSELEEQLCDRAAVGRAAAALERYEHVLVAGPDAGGDDGPSGQ
jgi:hypothetical protein